MALNRKGSRRVTVDGIEYRWRIRRKPSYMQGLCWTPLTYAVEAASGNQPGTTLIVNSGQAHPSNWVGVETEPIRPAHVAASIREARDKAGIQPGSVLLSSSTDRQDSSPSHETERSRAAHLARHHGLVTRWMRCYWDEEDIWSPPTRERPA
ncbi:hypothetical protein ACFV1S_30195 [Streptomyces globisporus]|uniref:hypothetical protein n=1 Tax=Streptomyces TaxID=1883 RepID=UPI001F52790C|nr:hypothetical protein [Streptomyces sp. TSRI0445]